MTRCPCLDNWTPAAGDVVRAVVGGHSFGPGDLGWVVEIDRSGDVRIRWFNGHDKEWLIPGEMEPEAGHAPGCAAAHVPDRGRAADGAAAPAPPPKNGPAALVGVVDSTVTFNGAPIYVTDAVLPYGAAVVIVRPMPPPTTCAATCAGPTGPTPPGELPSTSWPRGIQREIDAERAAHDAGLAERIRVQLDRAWRAELDQAGAPARAGTVVPDEGMRGRAWRRS